MAIGAPRYRRDRGDVGVARGCPVKAWIIRSG
jgi:hypothetical protein